MRSTGVFRAALVGIVAALALAAFFSRRVTAVALDERGTRTPPKLTTVTCTLQSGGIVRHLMDGTYPGLHPTRDKTPFDVPLTVAGTWNPTTKEATEYISWTGDIGLRPMPAENERWGAATMTCPSDPWENAVTCKAVSMQGFYKSMAAAEGGNLPVAASFFDNRDRAKVREACVQHPLQGKKPPPTPDTRQLVSEAQLPAPCKTCASPQFGATYAGGVPPANLKPGTMISVPITVTNTGCMVWPGQSATFHLGTHWFQGATPVVLDGLRTVLPHRVCPGETVQMMGSLKIPSAPGSYTLKWDLVEEGVAWFANKGVPSHDVPVTVP